MKTLGLKNIIMTVFIGGAVLALLVFSGVVPLGKSSQDVGGSVEIWGSIPFQTMQPYIDQIANADLTIRYVVKSAESYESELVNALAAGKGPDLFIMPHEDLLRQSDKVLEIPYTSFPKNEYQLSYIDEARLFMTPSGITALPLAVDPLVMYTNTYLLSSAFVLEVPEYWDEFIDLAPKITLAEDNGRINMSAVALGSFDNIRNAKAILSTLFLQNENPLVATNASTAKKFSTMNLDQNYFQRMEEALTFYTSFAHIENANYSWNEALPSSRELFIAGDLAFYFGYGSELETISKKNPNLDFTVNIIPQLRAKKRKLSYGSLLGIGVNKQTGNIPGAISVASSLTGKDIAGPLSRALLMAPARRDLLQNTPEEASLNLLYNSAIIAAGWTDPDPSSTTQLFRRMIQDINAGAATISDAVQRSHVELNTILNRTINTTIPDPNI